MKAPGGGSCDRLRTATICQEASGITDRVCLVILGSIHSRLVSYDRIRGKVMSGSFSRVRQSTFCRRFLRPIRFVRPLLRSQFAMPAKF